MLTTSKDRTIILTVNRRRTCMDLYASATEYQVDAGNRRALGCESITVHRNLERVGANRAGRNGISQSRTPAGIRIYERFKWQVLRGISISPRNNQVDFAEVYGSTRRPASLNSRG